LTFVRHYVRFINMKKNIALFGLILTVAIVAVVSVLAGVIVILKKGKQAE